MEAKGLALDRTKSTKSFMKALCSTYEKKDKRIYMHVNVIVMSFVKSMVFFKMAIQK